MAFPLFFAAVSAGYLGASPYSFGHAAPLAYTHAASPLSYAHAASPLTYAHSAAPYSYGHSYSHASPLTYAAAPVHYSAPAVVKSIAPVHYAAPVVKHVVPAATSYSNTYKVIWPEYQSINYGRSTAILSILILFCYSARSRTLLPMPLQCTMPPMLPQCTMLPMLPLWHTPMLPQSPTTELHTLLLWLMLPIPLHCPTPMDTVAPMVTAICIKRLLEPNMHTRNTTSQYCGKPSTRKCLR